MGCMPLNMQGNVDLLRRILHITNLYFFYLYNHKYIRYNYTEITTAKTTGSSIIIKAVFITISVKNEVTRQTIVIISQFGNDASRSNLFPIQSERPDSCGKTKCTVIVMNVKHHWKTAIINMR